MNLRRHALHLDPTMGAAALGLPDPDPEPTGGGTPPTAPADGQQQQKPDEPLGEGGKAALDKERATAREATRRAAAAEAELQKLRDKDLSEQQRLERDAADATSRADQAEARALRLEVAADKGLDLKLAARLVGSTREELEADAETLQALLPTPAPANGGEQRPQRLQPDRGQGAKPAPVKGGFDAGAARARERYGPPPSDAA